MSKKFKFDSHFIYRTALALACDELLYSMKDCNRCKDIRERPRFLECNADDSGSCAMKLFEYYAEDARKILEAPIGVEQDSTAR